MRLRHPHPGQEPLFVEILRVAEATHEPVDEVCAVYCYALDSSLREDPNSRDQTDIWDEIQRTAIAVYDMKSGRSPIGTFDRTSRVRVGWLQSVCHIYEVNGSGLRHEDMRFVQTLRPLLEPLKQTRGHHDVNILVQAVRQILDAV